MEKSATWHRRLGLTLRLARYVKESIEELQISLKLDDTESFTYFGLAWCSEIRKEFSEAIHWMRQGLDRLEDGNDSLRSAQLIALSRWHLELLEVDVAIKCAEEARILDPHNVLPAYAQLKALNALELPARASRTFEYLELLRTLPTECAGLSMLGRVFAHGTPTNMLVVAAANTADHYQLVFDAYNTAEAECEAMGDNFSAAYFRFTRGELLDKQMNKPEEAMIIFEELLAREVNTEYANSSTEDKWNFIKSNCSLNLSVIYFNLVVASRRSGKDAPNVIAKLENLAKKSYGSSDVFGTGNASVALAALYRMQGRREEADQTMRERILQSIAILEDTDPENDIVGYFGLAQTLLMAGRRDDAVAAAAPVVMSLDMAKVRHAQRQARATGVASPPLSDDAIKHLTAESSSPSLDQAKSEDQDEVDTSGMMALLIDMWETSVESCDGCDRVAVDHAELYWCEFCIDTALCEVCYPKMKAGELKRSVCSPEHTFTRIYPVPEDAKGVATHVVKGKILPRKEWLDKLRSEWTA